MAVTKTGTIIAIWVVCGVLIVAIVVVLIILCFRRERRKAQHRYLASTHSEGSEEEGGKHSYYPGYARLQAADLCTDPSPGSHTSPRVVNLRRLHSPLTDAGVNYLVSNSNNTGGGGGGGGAAIGAGGNYRSTTEIANAPCDILVNIFYVDPSTADTSALQSRLLGSDEYYSSAFLLYTAPLEFIAPGTYVIQAYTVYETIRAVGPVHQFIFHVHASTASGTGGAGNTAGMLLNAPATRHRNNDIEINLSSARNAQDAVLTSQANAGPLVPAIPLGGLSAASARGPAPMESAAVPSSVYGGGLHGRPPLPPKITPAEGTVTTRTPISIAPNERSTTADQIRYSTDGSYPTVLYTGPFYLSLPPESILPEQRLSVTVKAIAVSGAAGYADPSTLGANEVSEVTSVTVKVRHAGYSFFDPSIPAPSMRLRAVDATLYFDESKNPPGTRTVYQLLYVNDVRRHKAKFSRRRCSLYERNPIPIDENVALVYAWTVEETEWERGAARAEDRSRRSRDVGLVQSEEDEDEDGNMDELAPGRHGFLRSVATVYDCARAASEQAKPSKKRVAALRANASLQLLPAPVICVSCAEMEIEFEDVPANCVIAYTLNNTEPALYDVVPPACAVPVASAATASVVRQSRATNRGKVKGSQMTKRSNRSPSSDSEDGDEDGEFAEGDDGGLCTFRYVSGKSIKVTLLETEGVYVTARLFLPIVEGSSGEGGAMVVGALGGQGGSAGHLVGYRFGKVFHRGFFFSDS